MHILILFAFYFCCIIYIHKVFFLIIGGDEMRIIYLPLLTSRIHSLGPLINHSIQITFPIANSVQYAFIRPNNSLVNYDRSVQPPECISDIFHMFLCSQVKSGTAGVSPPPARRVEGRGGGAGWGRGATRRRGRLASISSLRRDRHIETDSKGS